jgi:succinate-semialdehyde dehydrogenase/glutarate-semialdehyde dehydrogenase
MGTATTHEAFGRWRRRPIAERAAIVHRAGELLAEPPTPAPRRS